MKKLRSIAAQFGRVFISILLLVWIFHVIFMEQGSLVAPRLGLDWSQLNRSEQWSIAWQHGPKALWEIITLIRPLSFFLSLLSVGATVLLGAWRWHILLEAQGICVVFRRTFQITMIGQFFNSFLLGSTGGDLLKAYYGTH
ncbi:MAG: flippase-like domain-containing protein, partial [Verrucomicrobia bacterium]|nr:flippase-like domain-containing protein [Verrucomicrobiota bacterium]